MLSYISEALLASARGNIMHFLLAEKLGLEGSPKLVLHSVLNWSMQVGFDSSVL